MPRKVKSAWNYKLREAREEMGFSLSQAVDLLKQQHKISMDKSHLAKIERGEIGCSVDKFQALCNIYCIDANWILDLKDS